MIFSDEMSVMCISVCMKYSIPQLTVSVYRNYYLAMLSLHKCMQQLLHHYLLYWMVQVGEGNLCLRHLAMWHANI